MFHRKVHPESSTTTEKPNRPHKNEIKNGIFYEGGCYNGDRMLPDEDIMIFPQRTLSKESIRRYKSQSNPPQFTLCGNDSNGNREYWIKTDADCKYKNHHPPPLKTIIPHENSCRMFCNIMIH